MVHYQNSDFNSRISVFILKEVTTLFVLCTFFEHFLLYSITSGCKIITFNITSVENLNLENIFVSLYNLFFLGMQSSYIKLSVMTEHVF